MKITVLTFCFVAMALLGCSRTNSELARGEAGANSAVNAHPENSWAFTAMSNDPAAPKILYAPPGSSNAPGVGNKQPPFKLDFRRNNEPRAQRISCVNNLKQVGLAFRIWAGDNDGKFPFNVSTNLGGSMELCSLDINGFDLNAAFHFQIMSNELSTPMILICPKDKARKRALNFGQLQSTNVTYLVRSGTNVSDANPKAVLAVCPIDGNTVYCDATVVPGKGGDDWPPGAMRVQ